MELFERSNRLVGMEITRIATLICVVRGQRVMMDRDLASLYGVQTGALNRAVRRNPSRFPADFMFQLSGDERDILKCQIGISRWGGDRALPFAFTEQGVAMLSSVLRSERAVQVNVAIMRAFVRMRHAMASNRGLAKRVARAEAQLRSHEAALGEHAKSISTVFEEIRGLIERPAGQKRKIGFSGGQ
jgi:hypothetical protein